jgi:excisionase family DNA binding protein
MMPEQVSPAALQQRVADVPRLALRIPEAAKALGISERKLSELTQAGEVPHVRVAGMVLFPVDRMRDWLKERSQ